MFLFSYNKIHLLAQLLLSLHCMLKNGVKGKYSETKRPYFTNFL